ncbi:MAG: metallophosphoesterase [Solirubrobacterales bacterium]|nr:metallophosphoesterase [Solirubrobacterales bacterium]
MRLLVLADQEPVVPLGRLVEAHRPDVVITLGDLRAEVLDPLPRHGVCVLGVYGNHDDGRYLEAANATDLHLGRATIGGTTFAGFQGCVCYRRGAPLQYTQRQASRLGRRIPRADVLLSHAPPRGVHEEPEDRAHEGFDVLRRYDERVQPRLHLHGHTPAPPRPTARIGRTQVVHVVGHRVVDL